MAFARRLAALLFTAGPLSLFALGASAQDPPSGAVVRGACQSSDKSTACTRCEVTLTRDAGTALPAGGGWLTGSCPKMAAGTYELNMAIPVKLITPQTIDTKTFFQVSASFNVRAHDAGGGKTKVLLHTEPLSWSWWSKTGMIIDKTDRVEIAKDAIIVIALKLDDAQYFVPAQTAGTAYRDGKLFIEQGALIRLMPPVSQGAQLIR